jgi:hypothetical protein
MVSVCASLRVRWFPRFLVFCRQNFRIQIVEFFWLPFSLFLRITRETDGGLSASKIDYIVIYISIYLI